MQYVIVGTGGQGVLFASKVLGYLALKNGQKVLASEVHGMAQRGGSVVSHFKVGDYSSPLVTPGHADVILAFDQNEAARSLEFLHSDGTVVVNLHDTKAWNNAPLAGWLADNQIRVCAMEGYEILKRHMGGRFLFMNVLILGALVASGVAGISYDEMEAAVGALAPEKFKADNLKVLKLGYDAVMSRKE
ncbi:MULTISPECIES: 2-oxoacid:acceptor oxidoreductase family protein [Jonquetella]|uniref:2-oxoacid:ferredoxin oxidoreductase, gamma subunit n=1 Tax=Jonquetella anthropi DSM 22815 TaxID=885272 RepID=H0UK19_9BACT|nr:MULTISPECIES: 2-oxoacid:acceptor oxidoreductase family protein [Jonquetella]EEX48591.1 putative indolepyruvate ferredoxin oxidoreductase, beta subunit [Jonquetella anthropi E3_33 E1]EHM13029.1 2-oxoacid:ferredoxin oxidoreductase, gamma subunit [Jonquetella anthropi DSM 22815]ERL23800.1 putative indolepyruvate ferredoxin oxidoreductase, beta subunit [Jonquetella sp. BV3C21]